MEAILPTLQFPDFSPGLRGITLGGILNPLGPPMDMKSLNPIATLQSNEIPQSTQDLVAAYTFVCVFSVGKNLHLQKRCLFYDLSHGKLVLKTPPFGEYFFVCNHLNQI